MLALVSETRCGKYRTVMAYANVDRWPLLWSVTVSAGLSGHCLGHWPYRAALLLLSLAACGQVEWPIKCSAEHLVSSINRAMVPHRAMALHLHVHNMDSISVPSTAVHVGT